MGKVEDMRRLREAQAGGGASAAAAPASVNDEVGTCAGCGKPKPLQRGVIANHQKGLGKMCPGSRKPPA